MTDTRFTFRFEDGRERSFASAADMVEWLERQKSPAPRKRRSPRGGRPVRNSAGDNEPRRGNGAAPLARFATRKPLAK